jgi:DNA-binding NarL/FixJ family response regulator
MNQMDKLDIAIVDDHQLFADAIKNVLPIYGTIKSIVTFNTGKQLYTHLETNSLDLILLDLGIRDGDNGFEILKEVKYRRPQIKIIVVSMHTQQEYVSRVQELGGNGYVPKDAGAKILKDVITSVFTTDTFCNASNAAYCNPFNNLSPTENRIATLIIKGKSNKEIAEELNRSKETIDTHRKRIYRKLDVHSIVQFIKLSVKYGMVTDAVE